jgi:hypothetical protein
MGQRNKRQKHMFQSLATKKQNEIKINNNNNNNDTCMTLNNEENEENEIDENIIDEDDFLSIISTDSFDFFELEEQPDDIIEILDIIDFREEKSIIFDIKENQKRWKEAWQTSKRKGGGNSRSSIFAKDKDERDK